MQSPHIDYHIALDQQLGAVNEALRQPNLPSGQEHYLRLHRYGLFREYYHRCTSHYQSREIGQDCLIRLLHIEHHTNGRLSPTGFQVELASTLSSTRTTYLPLSMGPSSIFPTISLHPGNEMPSSGREQFGGAPNNGPRPTPQVGTNPKRYSKERPRHYRALNKPSPVFATIEEGDNKEIKALYLGEHFNMLYERRYGDKQHLGIVYQCKSCQQHWFRLSNLAGRQEGTVGWVLEERDGDGAHDKDRCSSALRRDGTEDLEQPLGMNTGVTIRNK